MSERERKPVEKYFKSVSRGSRRVERPATSPDIMSDHDVVRCNKAPGSCLGGRQRGLTTKLDAQVSRTNFQSKSGVGRTGAAAMRKLNQDRAVGFLKAKGYRKRLPETAIGNPERS